MRRKGLLTFAAGMLLALPLAAWADSITPSSFSTTIPVGGSVKVNKTVTINKGTPTTSKVDVFFLADTTGSMGGPIGSVIASASSILSDTAGLGDVQFAVGEYKDVGDVYVYRLNQDITGSQAAAQAGINLWAASGGGDYPEADLYGLKQLADTTSWRAGSTRIAVWFGDAPSHDPANDPASPTSQADAIAALNGKSIKVEAINVGTLDAFAPFGGNKTGLNDLGQAEAVAAATGGAFFTGIDSTSIVDAIKNAITSAFATYTNVGLDLSEVPGSLLSASSLPTVYVGAFDRSTDNTFGFELTFNCLAPGIADFNVYALVDGGRVATETDHIVQGVPEPATLLLLGSGLLGLGAYRRKKLPKA